MANFNTLVETFDSAIDTTTKWTIVGGSATVSGGELLFRPNVSQSAWSQALLSQSLWTLGTSAATAGVVEFVPYSPRNNGLATWGLINPSQQGYIIEQVDASTYQIGAFNSGASVVTSVTTTDRYWRVYVSGTNNLTVNPQSSADGVTWTARPSQDMSSGSVFFTWQTTAGVSDYTVALRMTSGTGTTPVPAFRGINEPAPKTSVTAVAATSSSSAPVPVVQQRTTITAVVATVSSSAPAPTVWISVPVPAPATSATVFPPPTLNLPVPVSMSPPPSVSSTALYPPTVIAPSPTTITATVATSSSSAPAPTFDQIFNTSIVATVALASISCLPPGEYVRVSSPPAAASALLLPALRVGPALSRFALTVVQTPRDFGGASVYYRLNDATTTLTDALGLHHGGWSGAQTLVTGAAVNDPNQAMQFNGTTTVAYNGLMPDYQPVTITDRGVVDGGVTKFRAFEYPAVWGWSAIVAFRTLAGATKEMYVFSRASTTLIQDVTLRILNGRLIARWTHGPNADVADITAGPSVNDGNWHMAVVTAGYPLDSGTHTNPMRLYLDGVLQGVSNVFNPETPTRPLTIGGIASIPSMEGALDEYAEYDYALSQWEVLELWNQLGNLTGPGLVLEPPLVTTTTSAPAPTLRKSAVLPLNEFFDDFSAPFIDRTKWRDASATARVIAGDAVLRASGERLLTADYFQTKDSSFVVRLDTLPLREGYLFIGLVNENDTVPDAIFGGINPNDPTRPHRAIGFDFSRSTTGGRTTTVMSFFAQDGAFPTYAKSIAYVPDDPNYPTPHKWLRLDIEPSVHGGATWFTSPDGVTWTQQFDAHGGQANAKTTVATGPNGQAVVDASGAPVLTTTYTYDDADAFRLFPSPAFYNGAYDWRGYMRVQVRTERGNAATTVSIDNVNVLPVGTGTPADILAKPALVLSSSSTDYLAYALNPRVYTSATDISIEPPVFRGSLQFLVPPPPVYVDAPLMTAQMALAAPQRAGDALPVAVLGVTATVTAQAPTPAHAGEAQDFIAQPNQATAYYVGNVPEIHTDQSSPAPVAGRVRQTVTLRTRNVRVLVTQN